jgi:PIN domain nuclease of toxin-antitoxin system
VHKEEQVAIDRLDYRTQELLEETKEAHAKADAHVSACAKLQEDLNQRVAIISQWELAVAKRERELQGKEEEITNKLKRKRSKLKSCADNLNAREAALEAE